MSGACSQNLDHVMRHLALVALLAARALLSAGLASEDEPSQPPHAAIQAVRKAQKERRRLRDVVRQMRSEVCFGLMKGTV